MTDIPDIRSALIEGRYTYDFVRDLCGDMKNTETAPRLQQVEQLLVDRDGGKALYVLIIAGTRKMLDARAELLAGKRPADAEVAGLVARFGDDRRLNSLALNTSSGLGGEPGPDAK